MSDSSATPARWRIWAGVVVIALAVATLGGGAVSIPSAVGVGAMVAAALVDVRSQRLPDRLVAFAAIGLAGTLVVDVSLGGPASVPGIVAATALLACPLLVLHLISPSSMGFGDVKAAAVLGAAIGAADWRLALPALALAAGASATVALVVGARTIPFGPGLVSGAALALVLNPVFLPNDTTAVGARSAAIAGVVTTVGPPG